MRELSIFEKRIVDTVHSHGWFVLSVSPAADSNDPKEWFTYTIGLPKTFDWPEIICFGLETKMMAGMLNDTVEECRQRGVVPEHGLELHQVLNGYPVRLIDNAVIPDHYLGTASWFAQLVGTPDPPSRLQLTWPDSEGRYPDDPSCSSEVRDCQMPLERR